MTSEKSNSNKMRTKKWCDVTLLLLGVLLCLTFAYISVVGKEFRYENNEELPIVHVVAFYFFASILALTALGIAPRCTFSRRRMFYIVFIFAISFRAIQIFSPPILELDLYRYMWDGIVANEGVSPFRFSPEEALSPAIPDEVDSAPEPEESDRIREIATRNESFNTIAQRVHFPEYSTIYPPVSQWFFAIAMWCVPDNASVEVHLFVMKTMLVLFDLATLLLVWKIILSLGVRPGWVVAYAWNPLVIKEIANSGHLDSIAVFFMTATVCLVVEQVVRLQDGNRLQIGWILSASVMAGMGVGAKIFPVIIIPLLFLAIAKWRFKIAVLFAVVFALVAAAVMVPMLRHNKLAQNYSDSKQTSELVEDSKEGLSSFLTEWRMNDLVFSCVLESVKPDDGREQNRPWYIVIPNSARQKLNEKLTEFGVTGNIPFHVARAFTLFLFLVVYGLVAWQWWRDPTAEKLMNFVLIIVAAFFFLQPTQNPWYWLWAMPFVGFAKNKGWLVVSMFLFTYYLRFWFRDYYEGAFQFAGIEYRGVGIFDFLIIFVEFGPVAIGLLGFWIWKFFVTNNVEK